MSADNTLITIATKLRAAGCVFAEEEAKLLTAEVQSGAELDEMVQRRVSGIRLEHILGWAGFMELRVRVGEGVFVPRKRTEFLVSQAITLTPPNSVVVDICCGSGALGLALASSVKGVELHSADIDPVAVSYARQNVAEVGGSTYIGDLFVALPTKLRGRVATLLANVPYVPTDAIEFMPREARLHEPRFTLDGGDDGLDLLRRVAQEAPQWLAPKGYLLIEIGSDQVAAATAVFERHNLVARILTSETYEATVICGQLLN